ncbi:MAG TPA: NUDIX hydrolase [Saprospiraceae bacterium]|nr:NUDIX hydrolase [Saprospiraceae bacterium]HNG89271.1 NUDIX hydrolase [Saprospiraceae bacterium]
MDISSPLYTLKGNSPDTSDDPWTTLSERTAYENPWIRVSHREVLNPSGGPGIYGVVHFKNVAIGVVPVDERGFTWLVGQYRYTLGRYSWEIPEGGCPLGTPLLESARRELLEEAGITAQYWTPILEMHLSNSVSDEYGVAFLAQGLSLGESQPEETERLDLRHLPLAEAVRMVLEGEITDALSVAALLKVHLWQIEGKGSAV